LKTRVKLRFGWNLRIINCLIAIDLKTHWKVACHFTNLLSRNYVWNEHARIWLLTFLFLKKVDSSSHLWRKLSSSLDKNGPFLGDIGRILSFGHIHSSVDVNQILRELLDIVEAWFWRLHTHCISIRVVESIALSTSRVSILTQSVLKATHYFLF
jgi:hypothetical protein